MTERLRSASYANSNITAKMANDLTPRKTMLILVIVAGCFAVLWPKVFYPMLVGSANNHMKPSPIDKTTGCCDVISETDVNTIKIMSELCRTIIKRDEDTPLTGREFIGKCQNAVLETCGIDISAVLQEQVKLGQTVKQILDEIRSLNGSLCLKYNFGVSPWRLGVPHRITAMPPSPSVKQERPLHVRSELVHPAFRERGRAIPQPQPQPVAAIPPRSPKRIVEGRPGPIPAMRPTLGGAGHVVPPPKQGTGSMGLIMPIYTIGIVIFFTYTVMKIVFKKQPEALYPPIEPDPHFRREVFESERSQVGPKLTRDGVSSKLGDAELDQLRRRLRETELAMERIVEQMAKVPLKLQDVVANGNVVNTREEDQPTVKVLGMVTTASCEGGKKWSRPDSPVMPSLPPQAQEPAEPPQEIFLEGALPAQSHLLVADSATEAQTATSDEDPAVVLAGKMTLSVISLDSSENGTDESSNSSKKPDERSSSNVSDEFEKIEIDSQLEDQINNIIEEAQVITEKPDGANLLEELEKELKKIESEAVITRLDDLGLPDIENVEDKIIAETLDKYLPLHDFEKEFTVKEIAGSAKQDFGKEIVEENLKQMVEDQLLELEPKSEVKNGEPEEIIIGNGSAEADNEENLTKPKAAEEEKEAVIVAEELESIKEPLEEKIIKDLSPKTEMIPEKKLLYELDPLESVIASLTSEQAEVLQEVKAAEKETENVTAEPVDEHKGQELRPVDTEASNKEQTRIFTEKEIANEIKSGGAPEVEPSDGTVEAQLEKSLEVVEKTTPEDLARNGNTLAKEKETFDRLNEAIADLSSELKAADAEETDRLVVPEDEGEVGYGYDSDNEEIDEEIRNVDRLDDLEEAVGHVNGDDQEQSKYATASNATLAENEISDDENLQDEEEEIEEIIEYITDDEEEEEEVVQPAQRNNVNHVNESSDLRQ